MVIATSLAGEFSIVKVQRVEFLKKQRTRHLYKKGLGSE